jgi:hypothetical protein
MVSAPASTAIRVASSVLACTATLRPVTCVACTIAFISSAVKVGRALPSTPVR